MQFPEIVAAGIYNASLTVKNREITKNRKTTMFELELPIEDGGVSYINTESAPITRDLFICAKPGQIRHTRLPYRCYYIHFLLSDGEICRRLQECPNYITVDNYAQYREIFESLCHYYDSCVAYEMLMLQSLLLRLLHLLFKEKKLCGTEKTKKNNERAIRTALSYINENLSTDLSLKTLAEVVSFSPIYFHNCFRASTGKTLRAYVEEQRIRKAVSLLMGTELTLSDIAYECGFSSQSYFSYAFKKRMKLTPRQYAAEAQRLYDL